MAELNLNFYRVFKARTESWATDCAKDVLSKWTAFEEKETQSLRIVLQIDDDIPEDLTQRRLFCVEDMLMSNNVAASCKHGRDDGSYLITIEVSSVPADFKSRVWNCDNEICQCATTCH